MKAFRFGFVAIVLLVAGAFGASKPACADTIGGPGTGTDPTDIVSINDLLGASPTVTLNGDKVGSISNVSTNGELLSFTYTLPNGLIFVPTATWFRRMIDPGGSTVSDIFLISTAGGTRNASVEFASDPATLMIPGGAINLGNVTETGALQDMFDISGAGMFLTFQAGSSEVPEPTSLILLLTGLVGVSSHRFRRT